VCELGGAGVPEEEATFYQGEFESGRTIVTVTADDRSDEVTAILRRHHAYDVSARDRAATTAPATTIAAEAPVAPVPAPTPEPTPRAAEPVTSLDGGTLELKEERLNVETQPVETGVVRVAKEVTTETQTVDVPVEREEVVIERTPVSGPAVAGTIHASDLQPGEEVTIPVHEEQVRVDKETVVTEEVKVGKRVVKDTERVSGKVRKEQVRVVKTGDV